MSEEVSNSIEVFYSYFINNIKFLCIDKAYKKSCPVLYIYNNKKKILVLMYLSKNIRN